MGHSIFGDKPVSILSMRTECESDFHEPYPDPKEWSTWKSFSRLISPTNLILRETQEGLNVEADKKGWEFYSELILINKTAIEGVVNKNIEIFVHEFGLTDVAKKIIDRLENSSTFHHALNGNEALKGILLGYGTENSFLYQRMQDLKSGKETAPRRGFKSVAHELNDIESVFKVTKIPSTSDVAPTALQFRMRVNSSESNMLLEKYGEVQKLIEHLINTNRLLEESLLRW